MTPSAAQDRHGTSRDATPPRTPLAEQEAARLEELAADARRDVQELQALVAERATDADRFEAAVRALRGEHAPSVQGLPSSQASAPERTSAPPPAPASSTRAPLQDAAPSAERQTSVGAPSQSSIMQATPAAELPAAAPRAEVTSATPAPLQAEPPRLEAPPAEVTSASSPSSQASAPAVELPLSGRARAAAALAASCEREPCPDCGEMKARSGMTRHRGSKACKPAPPTPAGKAITKEPPAARKPPKSVPKGVITKNAPKPKPAPNPPVARSAPSAEATPAPAGRNTAWGSTGGHNYATCPDCDFALLEHLVAGHRGSVFCLARQTDRAAAAAKDPEPAPRRLAPAPERWVAPSRRAVETIPSMLGGRPVPPGELAGVALGMTRSIAAAPERMADEGGAEVSL